MNNIIPIPFRSKYDNKYHYFYKITNLINNKFYYGIHSTYNLNDGYMGSGSLINKAKKKYGCENFKKEILEFFETRDELKEKERIIVNSQLLLDKDCYNLSEGGKSGSTGVVVSKNFSGDIFAVRGNDPRLKTGELVGVTKGWVLVKNSKGEIFSVKKGDPRLKTGELVGVTKGYGTFKDKNGDIVYMKLDDPRLKTNEFMGLTTGKIHIYNPSTYDEIMVDKDVLTEYLKIGWKKGSPSSIKNKGKKLIHKNGENKYVSQDDLQIYLNDGWELGNSMVSKVKGYKHINKDAINRYVHPDDLQMYLNDGWTLGIYKSKRIK